MTPTKKQHYVPKFLLNYFATDDQIPKILVLSKKSKNQFWVSTRDAAQGNYFHECDPFPRGEIEKGISELETMCAPILQDIIKTRKLPIKDEHAMTGVASFVALQLARSPQMRNRIEHVRRTIVEQKGPHVTLEGDNKPLSEKTSEDTKQAGVMLLQYVPDYARMLLDKVWMLCEAPAGKSIICSDNPVIIENIEDSGNLGLVTPGTYVMMPISSKLLLMAECSRSFAACDDERIKMDVSLGEAMPLISKVVDEINSKMLGYSEEYVYSIEEEEIERLRLLLEKNPDLAKSQSTRINITKS